MELIRNHDVATEVLSRLPAKSLLAFKCTSKRWNHFISDPFVLYFHAQKLNTLSALLIQEGSSFNKWDFELINYVTLDKESCRVQDTVLDFLPEKVVLLASCSGLVCCRSFIHNPVPKHASYINGWKKEFHRKEFVIYICNPATRKWLALTLDECHVCEAFGLAFYPFGSSSTSGPSFKLVGIRQSGNDLNSYSFVIYSSETETWKTTQEVFNLKYEIYPSTEILVNGRFHWATDNHQIITFDAEQELSQVIKLPGVTMKPRCRWALCLGESEGYLHYIGSSPHEVKVWMLKEYNEPEWVVKFYLPMIEFFKEYPDIYNPESVEFYFRYPRIEYAGNSLLIPVSFYNDVLYFRSRGYLCSYDLKSRIFMKHCPISQLGTHFRDRPTVIPYSPSLASLPNFKSAFLTDRNFCRRGRKRKPKM